MDGDMDEVVEEKDDRLQTLMAILIAIVVAIGAIVVWRSSLAEDAAGDADFDGMRAVVFAENTRALNYVNAYEDYRNYLRYWYYTRLGELIDADLATADGEQADLLDQEARAAYNQADANAYFFETRYLNRDGAYNVQRQLGSMWADEQRIKDLEYESKFAVADRLRIKTLHLLLALMVISIAPVFYSLVESVSGGFRLVMITIGSVFAIAGTILAVLIEFTR